MKLTLRYLKRPEILLPMGYLVLVLSIETYHGLIPHKLDFDGNWGSLRLGDVIILFAGYLAWQPKLMSYFLPYEAMSLIYGIPEKIMTHAHYGHLIIWVTYVMSIYFVIGLFIKKISQFLWSKFSSNSKNSLQKTK